LVWSDPEVQKLAANFVPAADEVNVILWQREKEEADLFRVIGNQGHYQKPQQGVYAATPSGKLLASTNERDAKVVAAMLRAALEKWNGMDRKDRLMEKPPKPGRAGPMSLYPEGGLVLEVFLRDLPRADGEVKGFWAGAWNADVAWFTKDEARSFVPDDLKVGARRAMAETPARRLVKFHLVDHVRGETSPFGDADVKKAEIALVVQKVEGPRVDLRIEGATRAVQAGEWATYEGEVSRERGYEAKLEGRATFDSKEGKFTRFDLVAAGPRWGGTSGVRHRDLEPQPMGVAFRLAGDVGRVPPAFVLYQGGWDYFK
jgi:hypothetical protein